MDESGLPTFTKCLPKLIAGLNSGAGFVNIAQYELGFWATPLLHFETISITITNYTKSVSENIALIYIYI